MPQYPQAIHGNAMMVPTSVSEWAPYRPTIIRLYAHENMRLKDVQHIMEVEHKFRASKHMYIDKFKAWGVTKQYRAADTQQLALQITAAVLNDQPLESITHRGRPVNLKKVLRHMTRSDRRGRDVKRARKRAVKPEPEGLAEKADDSAPITPITSPDESLSQSVSDLSSSNETQLTIYTPPHQTGSSHGASRTSTSPAPRSMTSSPGTGNLETILFDIGAFLSSDWTVTDTQGLPRTMFSHPGDKNHNPRYATLLPNTSPFFDEVKSAVYFLRSDSPHFAWPVLQEACDEASKSPFYPDRPFLVDLLAVLSPAKTKNHSSVRSTLLHFLATLCATRLGISHPLASICQQLAHDQATSSDIPVRALSYMHDLCSQNDSEPHPRNPTTKIQRALISIVRRDSDLDTAKRLAISAVEYCKSTLGHCHETTEQAMMELVYVQTYQGEYQTGLETCNEVLRSNRLRLGAAFPDSKASYAMENMAELQHYVGREDECIYWLRRALASAWKVRGGVASTIHVREKLEAMLITKGRFEDANELSEKYPSHESVALPPEMPSI